MIPFLKLIRYKNLLMVLLTMVLTKYALIDSYVVTALSNIDFLVLLSSVLFITAAGYVINDIYDIEVDKINNPDKVIISQLISKKNGWIFYFALSFIGLLLGIYISFEKQLTFFSLFFIGPILLLFFYSKFLKRLPLIGNLLISILVSLPIFLVYEFQNILAVKNNMFTNLFLSIVIFQYLLFAFITTLIRELIKDIEDIKGDYNLKMKTLPILIGKKRTRNIAIGLSLVLLFFIFLLLSDSFASKDYIFSSVIVIFSIIVIYFIYTLWNAKTKKQFHFLSNLMKLIMLLGILSMGLFKLI